MSDTCFANLSGSSVTTWAQLVKRLSKKTGAILTRVRVPGAARDFSPRVNFRCRLSYRVRTAPVCIARISISMHIKKSPILSAIPLFGHMKILHTLTGMGSAALVAAVPCPGKATRISCMEQGSNNFKKWTPKMHIFCVFRPACAFGSVSLKRIIPQKKTPFPMPVSFLLKDFVFSDDRWYLCWLLVMTGDTCFGY